MASDKKILGAVSVPTVGRTFYAGDEEEFEKVAKEQELDMDAIERTGAISGYGSKKAQEEGAAGVTDPRLANSIRAQEEKEQARKEGAKAAPAKSDKNEK